VSADESDKRTGRPRSAPIPPPGGPMETWLTELTPTAHRILMAARSILLNSGFEALTLEAVALEAGEDRATITRHFGTKAGLIQALFDDMGNELLEDVTQRVDALPAGEQRTHTLIRNMGRLAADQQLALGMFELAPHAIRDSILRARFAALYEWYLKTMLEESGMAGVLAETKTHEDRRDIETLPAICMAVIDGLSLQLSLNPEGVEVARAFALLDLFVSAVLDGSLRTSGRLEIAEDAQGSRQSPDGD
jgi:AcrR family transcriptional regulator